MPNNSNETQLSEVRVELQQALLGLFESDEKAATRWLNQECPALAFKTPINVVNESPDGVTHVINVIHRIEYGVHQ